METKVLVALCLVVALVAGVNGILVALMRNAKNTQHIRMWQKATRRARDPWEQENDVLQELSQLVLQFKEDGEKESGE